MRRLKRIWKRVKYKVGFTGWVWHYGHSDETWKVFKIAGCPQETFSTGSPHDCSGMTFCSYVRSYFFGIVTIGHFGVDV